MGSSLLEDMQKMLERLKTEKPKERNEEARRYAVTITEMEKAIAYYKIYILEYTFCPDE